MEQYPQAPSAASVWELADTLNGLMAAPNLIAPIPLAGVVVGEKATLLATERQAQGLMKSTKEAIAFGLIGLRSRAADSEQRDAARPPGPNAGVVDFADG